MDKLAQISSKNCERIGIEQIKKAKKISATFAKLVD
jgi:hypothetical protein